MATIDTQKRCKQSSTEQSSKRMDLPRSLNPWDRQGVIPWAQRQLPYIKNEFQHVADSVWNFAEDELFSGCFKPAADIAETGKAVVITIDLPGFEPDEIDIQVTENAITIRGERETACCDEEDVYLHRSERRCGRFSRTFALPIDVTEDVAAKCDNGVLRITLPKTKETNSRKIRVNS